MFDDQFYHGPAWVIKPRLHPLKEPNRQQPGPGHYHIPDRSIYERPGITIGSRFETSPPVSSQLLGFYFPKERSKTRTISIVPRRNNEHRQNHHSIPFYSPVKQTSHIPTVRLRPNFYKKSSQTQNSTSPGPTAYPMYEFDEDILPRPQPGFTQKARLFFDSNQSARKPNPPFYNPKTHRLPSFSLGKRFEFPLKMRSSPLTFYSPSNSKVLCASTGKPGATLKGRWSPFVRTFIPPSS